MIWQVERYSREFESLRCHARRHLSNEKVNSALIQYFVEPHFALITAMSLFGFASTSGLGGCLAIHPCRIVRVCDAMHSLIITSDLKTFTILSLSQCIVLGSLLCYPSSCRYLFSPNILHGVPKCPKMFSSFYFNVNRISMASL